MCEVLLHFHYSHPFASPLFCPLLAHCFFSSYAQAPPVVPDLPADLPTFSAPPPVPAMPSAPPAAGRDGDSDDDDTRAVRSAFEAGKVHVDFGE